MTDLYLIAHKVRGAPAFDIATRMTCPCCSEHDKFANEWVNPKGCHECDNLGYWWIIPTSGHRAYPYFDIRLDSIEFEGNGNYSLSSELANMPPDLPDHYLTRSAPTISLTEALGLAKPKPQPVLTRRL